MPVCPLCEHVQESGDECDLCGRRLGDEGEPARAVELDSPLDGLEPTQSVTPDVDSALLTDLEPTGLAPASVSADHGPPPPATCLACARVGAPGEVFCPVCGVKLSLARPSAPPDATPEPERRCGVCGFPVPREVCPACGTRHREG